MHYELELRNGKTLNVPIAELHAKINKKFKNVSSSVSERIKQIKEFYPDVKDFTMEEDSKDSTLSASDAQLLRDAIDLAADETYENKYGEKVDPSGPVCQRCKQRMPGKFPKGSAPNICKYCK